MKDHLFHHLLKDPINNIILLGDNIHFYKLVISSEDASYKLSLHNKNNINKNKSLEIHSLEKLFFLEENSCRLVSIKDI